MRNDLAALKPLATSCSFGDGQVVFRAGQAELDLFVVETGAIEIINPSDDQSAHCHAWTGTICWGYRFADAKAGDCDGDCARADTVDAGGGSTIAGGVEIGCRN